MKPHTHEPRPAAPPGAEDAAPDLGPLLAPRSVAVIGASDDPDKVGGRPIDYLRRFGFDGAVYPVNPNRSQIQGLASFATVDQLPEVPDVAVVAVGGEAAVDAVERCAGAGVGAAVVMASGFGEASEDGRSAQHRMVAAARAAGMRLVGPNCQGVANFANGAVVNFSTMYLEAPPADGPVAVISQSGSMSQVPYALLRAKGIGVRYTAATGNEADVSAAEVAAAVAEDPAIELLLLYVETIRDARWLARLGRVSAARRLPVVVLKAGRTPAGQEAARSHTGALANEDRVVDAFFERVGLYRARDLPDLMLAVDLHLCRRWRPSGRRLAVVSNSGASCVQAADAVTASGMALATLQPDIRDRIAAALPAFATPTNPVDLTAALLSNGHLFSEVLPVLGDDPGVDALVVALPVAGQGYDVDAFATDTAAFAATGHPAVVVSVHAPVAARFRAEGLPVFPTEVEAVAALDQWTTLRERAEAAADRPHVLARRPTAEAVETLDEAAGLAFLAAAGVPVVAHRLCADVDAAADALHELGEPVAVKGCSAEVAHKSELGLVALGLRTADEVRAAFGLVDERLRAVDPHPAGVLVSRMASGVHELMIGARLDPVFGPVVVVGDGGIAVEALPDLQVLLPPFGEDEVLVALSRLRVAPLLRGVRGGPAADTAAFASAVVAVGRLIADPAAGLTDLDVNPVIVGPEGEGCLAVDALVQLGRWAGRAGHPADGVP